MEPMIKIEHLDKTFNGKTQTVYALKDINLDIQKGDIFGIRRLAPRKHIKIIIHIIILLTYFVNASSTKRS